MTQILASFFSGQRPNLSLDSGQRKLTLWPQQTHVNNVKTSTFEPEIDMSTLCPSHNANLTVDLSGQVSHTTMNLHTSTISPYTLSQPSARHYTILRRTNLAARDAISNREKTATKRKQWWHQTQVSSSGASTRDNTSPQKQAKRETARQSKRENLPILGVISIIEVLLDGALPASLFDLPPINVVADMLLGVVPLKRHITDRVPRRHLHRTAIPITQISNTKAPTDRTFHKLAG
jgi:hypothetical protein